MREGKDNEKGKEGGRRRERGDKDNTKMMEMRESQTREKVGEIEGIRTRKRKSERKGGRMRE